MALLVNMVFGLNLPHTPSNQLDHLELFAGDMSVTRGEMEAFRVSSRKNGLFSSECENML